MKCPFSQFYELLSAINFPSFQTVAAASVHQAVQVLHSSRQQV